MTDGRPGAGLSHEVFARGERADRDTDNFISRSHMDRVRECVRTGGERAEKAEKARERAFPTYGEEVVRLPDSGAANASGGGDGVSAEPCKAYARQERNIVDRALGVGQAPRPVARRYAGFNRKALTHHREVCLTATFVPKAGMLSGRSTRRKA